MLSAEDNELITRVGPGTLMGNLMRQYWVPAGLSSELPAPDCPPVRIRLLCENLIGFRTTSGKVGLVANSCPHRGASLFFGRNEEEGLRCVYQGWKFDVTGACVDMPSEPAESNFKSKVKATAYPCVERGGLVWTYMGPRETPPPLPDLEPNMLGDNVSAQGQECNWLQSMENNMDTVHVPFLHFGAYRPEDLTEEFASEIEKIFPNEQIPNNIRFPAPNFIVRQTDFGGSSAAQRPSDKDENSFYYRMMNWHFPFYTQHPGGKMAEDGGQFVAVVPVDDTYTISYRMSLRVRPNNPNRPQQGVLPNTTDWRGRFRPEVTLAMDMNIDREVQKNGKNTMWGYTGITSVGGQDQGITDSQGLIQDRTIEHLGTTDRMVILARRRLLEAARALRDKGTVPPGVDEPSVYRQRSGSFYLPKNVDPWEGTQEIREAFKQVAQPPAIARS